MLSYQLRVWSSFAVSYCSVHIFWCLLSSSQIIREVFWYPPKKHEWRIYVMIIPWLFSIYGLFLEAYEESGSISSLSFARLRKVMVCYFVSDIHKVMTGLWPVDWWWRFTWTDAACIWFPSYRVHICICRNVLVWRLILLVLSVQLLQHGREHLSWLRGPSLTAGQCPKLSMKRMVPWGVANGWCSVSYNFEMLTPLTCSRNCTPFRCDS